MEMKKISILSILSVMLFCQSSLVAKELINELATRGDNPRRLIRLSKNNFFEGDELLSFWTLNSVDGVWTLNGISQSGDCITVKTSGPTPTRHFDFDPKKINSEIWSEFNNLNLEYDPDLRTELHEFELIFTEPDTNESDSIRIKLALKPSIPILSDFNLTYDEGVWEWNSLSTSAEMSFDVDCDRGERYFLRISNSHFFSKEDVMQDSCNWIWTEEVPVAKRVSYSAADWGEAFNLSAYNQYGWSARSDTYFTTDFITDPVILNHISELQNKTAISDPYMEKVEIYPDHINFNSLAPTAILADLHGIVWFKANNVENIDLSSFNPGFYILTYIDSNNKITTKKIIISSCSN